MSLPDIVIPVRRGDNNEELRYALRSIAANLPHRYVWITGYRPKWVTNAFGINVPQGDHKQQNSKRNLIAACRDEGVSENFVLWNDDFFLLAPLPAGVLTYHKGVASATLGPRKRINDQYRQGLMTTIKILRLLGVEEPLSYELHLPMPMTKSGLLSAYGQATMVGLPRHPALQLRTLYGNLANAGGEVAEDVKIRDEFWMPGPLPFVSTSEASWNEHLVVRYIKRLFPDPGPYEEG